MDFLLALGWIVASLVFGYLVTRSIRDHIRAHRKAVKDIDDIWNELYRLNRLIEHIDPNADPDAENVDLGGEIPVELGTWQGSEDDLPF